MEIGMRVLSHLWLLVIKAVFYYILSHLSSPLASILLVLISCKTHLQTVVGVTDYIKIAWELLENTDS
jgi:hypothetical protein